MSPLGSSGGQDALDELRALVAERADVVGELIRSLAEVVGVPIVLVSVVDDDVVRVVAGHGLDVDQVEKAPGLCAEAVRRDDLYVVPDATADELAATNPLVTGPPGVRFYAAAPLVTPSGERLGNLCVLDVAPRDLTEPQRRALTTFARVVVDELELQRRTAALTAMEDELADAVAGRHAATRRFDALADAMPVVVWTAGPDGGLDHANSAYWEYVGVEPGGVDLAAGDWIKGVHPDDRDRVLATWAQCLERGDPYETELRIRRHDGTWRWNVSTAYPIRNDDGDVVAWFGSATDVHDRRAAELALAERERRLRVILEAEPECVKVVSADGELLEMNPAGLAMVGAPTIDRVRGRPVIDLIHPDDVATFLSLHDRASRGDEGSAAFRIVGLDGTVRWVESRSVPLDFEPVDEAVAEPVDEAVDEPATERRSAVVSLTRDVTDERRDHLLRDAEARILEQLVAGAPLGAVLHEVVGVLDRVDGGAASILLVERGHLQHGAALHLPADYLEEVDGIEVRADVGSCGAAAVTGDRVVTIDIATDPLWDGVRDTIVAAGFAGCISTPVRDSTGEVVAVLARYLRESRSPTDRELAAVDRLARLASLAIERIRTDQHLRQTTALLRVASELGQLGGWWVDVPVSGEASHVVWSDEVAVIHDRPAGYQPTVDEGIAYYAPEYRQMITDAFTACVERGEPYDLEVEILSAAGRRRWCRSVGQAERDATGRIVRVAGAFQDITGYKESERALRENEERFRLLSQATSDVVFDWDLAADRVWYGDGLQELVGPLGSPTLSIEGVLRRIHPDDVERVRGRMAEVVAGAGELWEDGFRVLHADGHPIHVEVSAFLLRDDDGRGVRLVGSLVDTTERDALQDQLAQAQRLESLGRLTGGVAHDFNNLLTVIIGNLDLLADDLDDGDLPSSDDLEAAVDMIRASAERGAELTDRLLAFARRQPLTPQRVDVPALLDRLTGLLARTIGEDVELTVRHGPDPCAAMVDAAQLESAVLNVCINARDAMPRGGRLTIETATVDLDDQYMGAQLGLEPGEYVSIAITDDGVGMPPDVVQQAFEPFFTTKAPGRGSGLGLSMVYGFATQSRGHVRIYSEPGHGTTVRIYLPSAPVSDIESRPTVAGPAPGRAMAGQGERVLLVEDDELVRDVVAAQLRGLGYRVSEAGDGPTALALLRDAGPFALLFTDIVMPGGMNGRQLADAARRVVPDLPVLFTSGYTEDTVVHHGRLDPGVALLTKPYRLDDLAERVRRAIDDR